MKGINRKTKKTVWKRESFEESELIARKFAACKMSDNNLFSKLINL